MAFVNYNSFFNTQKAVLKQLDGSNYDAIDYDLVLFRFIMPMPQTIQTDNYLPRFRGGFVDNLL